MKRTIKITSSPPQTVVSVRKCAGRRFLAGVGVMAMILGFAGTVSAADVFLQAQSYDKTITLPDASLATVPMWGYASCTDATFTSCTLDTNAAGPQIRLTTADSLTVHLSNTLNVPVSIVIPGQAQAGGGNPVMMGTDARRVQSFTHETISGANDVTYTWPTLNPGTYLYQSGTNPSIQVPMGLHGALVVVVDATTPVQAYPGASYQYDSDAVLLFNEIDPIQNTRVSERASQSNPIPTAACVPLADYEANGTVGYPCTVDYNPIYFLVNGQPTANNLPAGDGIAVQNVLLRFLNAGLRTHTPAFVGVEMGLIAEDGNVYPGLPRRQATALLAAGKTLDAQIVVPADNVTLSLFDHMPTFNNQAGTNGGSLATLIVGTGTPPPPAPTIFATDDIYAVTEDTELNAASVLVNDTGLTGATVVAVSQPTNGSLVLNPDGTFTYTPVQDFSGTDTFSYSATLSGQSYPAVVTLNVSFVNDAPVAAADGPFVNTIGTAITVDAIHGVLGNDADPDGDTLTAVIEGTAPAGLILNADGSFTYDNAAAATFTYRASDGTVLSDPVVVELNVNPLSNIALTVVEPDGITEVTSYRWIVQEDATFHINPVDPQNTAMLDMLSLNFHKSSMPVVAQGCNDCIPTVTPFNQVALDPAKYYYVSVLPNDAGSGQGHTIGGAQILPGQVEVTVIVNKQEIPTAQISVFIFEDLSPTNGVPDATEPGLGGFQITLEDAGGRYGASAGIMSQDAFGAPLKNSLDCFDAAGPQPVGVILTCPDTPNNQTAGLVGRVLIKDIPPGKYGVIAVKPTDGEIWTQTSTIEGTKVIDAWVKAGEPPFFTEFGMTGPHAFIGFVNPQHTCIGPAPCQIPPLLAGQATHTITGQVTLLHDPRPPGAPGSNDTNSYEGLSHTRAWVGVNTIAGDGPNIASVQANADGSFSIPGIPNGTHQVVVWDSYLDQIISYHAATVAGGDIDLGNVSTFAWFSRSEHNVFLDANENGIRDDGELPIPEQVINLRWRDGTVNQTFPTDGEGFVPFDQTFPFFSWQVLEVDYTRFKPTGVTVTVDAGGDTSTGPYPGLLNPQVQNPALFADNESCTDASCLSRTEQGAVLTEAYQGFPAQTSIFDWGKVPYQPGENGGISGIVYYASTRGEPDPRLTAGDPWEPGIASVTMRLYRVIQLQDGTEGLTLIKEAQTDSWDKSLPTGCPGELAGDPFTVNTLGVDNINRCYDGWRNWNQVRPGVFDGGYAFNDILPGKYVVEAVLPAGYELYKEEDMNVGFGDAFGSNLGPAPVSVTLPNGALILVIPDQAMIQAAKGFQVGLAQPPCVGAYHEVPDELSLFAGEAAPFAQAARPLCDRKEVVLSDQGQSAADFHFFTSTPVAAQYTGLITDDLSAETNPNAPGFGEQWSPAFMPFSLRDFKGAVVYSGLTDAFGRYNGVLPSTFTANVPIPTGYSPAMMSACLNDAGPLKVASYMSVCYTAQFMPGTTTYLDTPLIPTAAFAAGFNHPDCAAPEGTPVIESVNAPGNGFGPLVQPGNTLLIRSQGQNVTVPNPAYEGPLAAAPYNTPTITRDFDFGAQIGTVELVAADGTRTPLTVTTWNRNVVRATAPSVQMTGQLVVTRGDNRNHTSNAVTVTVSNETPIRVRAGGSIQAAIDSAPNGALILVEDGTYNEQVIMWKPVRLQGSGSATVINALKLPPESLQIWMDKIAEVLPNVDLLPGQIDFSTEFGAGVTVLGKRVGGNNPDGFLANPSRIDGFTITGADSGGGIFVNGYAHNLEIANNSITGNSGTLHGGIRIGRPFLPGQVLNDNGLLGFNNNVNIHNNAVTMNGALHFESAGGGISLSAGSNRYTVAHNFICGNYTAGDGAGIGHLGLSNGGRIEFNKILFNQSYNQGLIQHGGGIVIAGEAAAPPALTLGSGNVFVDANLIQGNNAGSGHGGGIRAQLVNGAEIATRPNPWVLRLSNNMIVNNVAAWSGGGISMQDTVRAQLINNTVANNDTLAVASGLVVNNASIGQQPAGIVAERHSLGLAAALGTADGFSDPVRFVNNIVWHNRVFTYNVASASGLLPELASTAIGECVAGANYWDLGVLGEPLVNPTLAFDPRRSILTDTTGYHGSNVSGDPDFLSEYCNGARTLSTPGPMVARAHLGEGGNFIDVRYGPLTPTWPAGNGPWDYHIGALSAGLNNGNDTSGPVPNDFDGEVRPQGTGTPSGVDRGADEVGGGFLGLLATAPATLNGNTLDFGNLSNGNYTSNVILSVSNLPVTFGTVTTTGARFSIVDDTCSGNTIPATEFCYVTVQFNANGNVVRSGSLTIPHNGIGNPTTLALTGQ